MRRRGRFQPFKLIAITVGPLQVQKIQRRGGHRRLDPADLERETAENARQAIREACRKNGTCLEEFGSQPVLLDIDALEPEFKWEPWDPGDFTLHEE